VLEPLLVDPPAVDPGKPGRPRAYTPRQCLDGILQLLYTGIRYADLAHDREDQPSGETCRRRLQEWIGRGVWQAALEVMVAQADAAGKLDWSRVVIDAKKGAIRSAPAQSTAGFPVLSTISP
jgi:transposase